MALEQTTRAHDVSIDIKMSAKGERYWDLTLRTDLSANEMERPTVVADWAVAYVNAIDRAFRAQFGTRVAGGDIDAPQR